MTRQLYLYLSTRGHRSGKRHEIEIWYVEHGGCCYLVAEKGEASHWVRNLRAEPSLHYRFGADWDDAGAAIEGWASFPEDPALLAAVRAKMEAKYGWSDGLVVAICAT